MNLNVTTVQYHIPMTKRQDAKLIKEEYLVLLDDLNEGADPNTYVEKLDYQNYSGYGLWVTIVGSDFKEIANLANDCLRYCKRRFR